MERAECFVVDACFLDGRVCFGFKQGENVVCLAYFLDEFGAVAHGVSPCRAGEPRYRCGNSGLTLVLLVCGS